MTSPAASRPVLAVDPNALQWHKPAELPAHFAKHSLDRGDCLRKSLSRGEPFTVDGYLQTQRDTVRDCRFLMRALIRNRHYPDRTHRRCTWAFGPNMFCVAMNLRTNGIVTAFHHHLDCGCKHHGQFEARYPRSKDKEDAFLDWLSKGEDMAASARVMLGSSVSHEIADVERLKGFPFGD